MVCIYCGGSTRVANSRWQKQPNQVWRRRECSSCRATFTTHEKVDLSGAIAVRDRRGQLAPFSRNTLLISIYESCKHRPSPLADAEGLTQTVITTLSSSIKNGILDRQIISSATHKILNRFDNAAATMYAAYHPSKID